MDESRVLARLDRIDGLDHRRVVPGELLAELRGLLREAEEQARAQAAAANDGEEEEEEGEEVVGRSARRVLGT